VAAEDAEAAVEEDAVVAEARKAIAET